MNDVLTRIAQVFFDILCVRRPNPQIQSFTTAFVA